MQKTWNGPKILIVPGLLQISGLLYFFDIFSPEVSTVL